MRHAAPARWSTGGAAARALGVALSVWSLATCLLPATPRYERVSVAMVAAGVLALAMTPRSRWLGVRTAASASAALLMAVAGIVAGVSLDEAFTLLSCGLLLAGIAGLAGRFAVRPGVMIQDELRALRRAVDRLSERAFAQPACACPHRRA